MVGMERGEGETGAMGLVLFMMFGCLYFEGGAVYNWSGDCLQLLLPQIVHVVSR